MYCALIYDYNITNNLVCDKMKIKIIISILILSIFFSGCIDDSISTQSVDDIHPQQTQKEYSNTDIIEIIPQKINDTSIMISIANTGNVPISAIVLRIHNINTFLIVGNNESSLGHLNPGDYTSSIFNIMKIPETDNNMKLGIDYTSDVDGKRTNIERIIYISDKYDSVQKPKNITLYWNFGCVKYCGEEGRPGESDSRFNIVNTGNVDIPKMKLIIDFYAYSGRFINTRSTDILFDWNMNPTEIIPNNSQGYMFIKVPSQYMNEETWSYAEIYLLKNNTRYAVTTWKSVNMKISNGEQNVMPPISGDMEIEI